MGRFKTLPKGDDVNHEKLEEEKRFGQFRIALNKLSESPKVCSRCIILKAEYDLCSSSMLYSAASPEFESLDSGFDPPFYRWWINENTGKLHVEKSDNQLVERVEGLNYLWESTRDITNTPKEI